MKLRMASCFLLTVLLYHTTLAQQQQNITPVSPEAAALAKMVNYPVNLNTGIPDISIPLYKIETGGMVLPITLQYHAGGFNINEHSNRAGLGWSLSCDLQITRTINGRDDLEGYIADNSIKCDYDDTHDDDYAFTNNNLTKVMQLANGEIDGSPDKYFYQLLNKSGSFYFRKNDAGTGYTIVPVPFDNIRIEFSNGVFIITDTDGTAYLFGASGNTYDGSLGPVFREQTGLVVTTWKCKTITNASNTETISFTYQDKASESFYQRPGYIECYSRESTPSCDYFYYTQDIIQTEHPGSYTYQQLLTWYPFRQLSAPKYMEYFPDKDPVFHLPRFGVDTYGNQVIQDYTYTAEGTYSATARDVRGVSLSKIQFRGGFVEFSGTDQLSTIQIQHTDHSLFRSFQFYHTQSGTNIPNNRLTLYLDSIHVKDSNGEIFERYHLLYKNKLPFGDALIGKDAWSFPNAYTNYITGQWDNVPPFSVVPHQNVSAKYFNRSCAAATNVTFPIGNTDNVEKVDEEGAQRGILKRIVYPTGGYVSFDYEANKYKEVGTEGELCVQMGGGLRICTITWYDGKSAIPASQKYYRYGDCEDGIGLAVNPPPKTFNGTNLKYDANSFSQNVLYLKEWGSPTAPCTTGSCYDIIDRETKTTYSPASSQNYTYPHGATVYYTKVTEYNNDLGKATGKTVHIFYPPYEFTQIYPRKIPYTNLDYLRPDGLMGREKRVEDYKYNNGHYSLVHSKEFEYTKYSQRGRVKVVFAFNRNDIRIAEAGTAGTPEDMYKALGGVNLFTTGQYGIEVAKLLLTGETEKWVTNAGEITQRTNYNYNSTNWQLASVETTKSDKSTSVKNLKYCYDFLSQPVYAQMNAKNMISQVIEEQVTSSVTGAISNTRTNFNLFNNNFIAPQSVQKSLGGGPLTTEIRFDQCDDKGNLLQSTDKNGIVTSYIWGYQQKYMLAKVTGSAYGPTMTGTTEGTLQGITDENQLRSIFNNYRSNNPDVLITSFTHKPLMGISSSTDASGVTRFFEYDLAGRLTVIKNNNGHILQTYNYNMLNWSSGLATDFLSTPRPPEMESYNITRADNSVGIYNATVPADLRYLYDQKAQLYYYDPEEKDELAATDVLIELYARFNPYNVSTLHLDLLKNGSVVYSRRFTFKDDLSPTRFYIPKGEYQVNLRLDNNFTNAILKNYYYSTAGAGQPENSFMMNGPVTINFVPGVSYSITSFDY